MSGTGAFSERCIAVRLSIRLAEDKRRIHLPFWAFA